MRFVILCNGHYKQFCYLDTATASGAATNDVTPRLIHGALFTRIPLHVQAMSLDKNLFTLQFTPSPNDPNVIDLVDPSGVVHYRKHRVQGAVYEINVYGMTAHPRLTSGMGLFLPLAFLDPISGSILISVTAPNAVSRQKTLELFNPSIIVELKDIGKVSFRWSFKWEEYVSLLVRSFSLSNAPSSHDFEWKKDECYMIRKPDPPVLVAVASEPPSRIRNGTVQILDYNLNR